MSNSQNSTPIQFSRLLVPQGPHIIINIALAQEIGYVEAAFLQNLNYWLTCFDSKIGVRHEGKRWIYNTYEAWQKQLPYYSTITIRRAIYRLEKLGLVIAKKLNVRRGNHTKYYTINFTLLDSLIAKTEPGDKDDKRPKPKRSIPPLPKRLPSTPKQKSNKKPLKAPVGEPKAKAPDGSPQQPPALLPPDSPSQKNRSSDQHELTIQRDTSLISSISSAKKEVKKPLGEGRQETPESSPYSTKILISKSLGTPEADKITPVNELIYQMKQIWEDIIEQGSKVIELSKPLCRSLIAALKYKFKGQLEAWKDFCQRIASSSFLMGKSPSGFKAGLSWVLKFKTMNRILGGELGVKDLKEVSLPQTPELIQTVVQEIEARPEESSVKALRLAILADIGAHEYQAWFKDTDIHIDRQTLTFGANTAFIADTLCSRYEISTLSKITSRLLPDHPTLFQVKQSYQIADPYLAPAARPDLKTAIDETTQRLEQTRQVLEDITTRPESQAIKDLRAELLDQSGVGFYLSWFKELQIHSQDNRVVFQCPTLFVKDYLSDRSSVLQSVTKAVHTCFPHHSLAWTI